MNRETPIGNGKDPAIIKKLQDSDKHTGQDLSGHILFGESFRNKDFSKSSLQSADLSWCDLSGCDFTNCDLTATNLEGAMIRNATVVGAKRNGMKVLKIAQVNLNDGGYYAFKVQGQGPEKILINEPGQIEYEFKMGKKSMIGGTLVNLLNMK